MMNESEIRKSLSDLPLGGVRFINQVSSTNDIAIDWAAEGALDLSLVCADEQTQGRGRGNRRWFTPSGTALAFSVVFRPRGQEEQLLSLFSGLGALAVCDALALAGLYAEIKWPNDVLLNGRKLCGVLVEAGWLGDKLESVILGIGVNVTSAAVPSPDQLSFPATSIESESRQSVNRLMLLKDILQFLLYWRGLMMKEAFLCAWQTRLAFSGQLVEINGGTEGSRTGRLDGLETDGSLRLVSEQGQPINVHFGDVRLRPVV
jgi:BirA family transcriptional regulator, biotin operon repressor / biotin---[acetyl-CoA-carboxylase] ligase